MSNSQNASTNSIIDTDVTPVIITILAGFVTKVVSNTPVKLYIIDKDFTNRKDELVESALVDPMDAELLLFNNSELKQIIESTI